MESQPLIGSGKQPPGPIFKYFTLFIISLICFGPYFAFDSIQNIGPAMKREIGITDTRFGILYSVYSLPNVVLPFFGGVMGDKLGLRLAALLLVTLVVIGNVIVAVAPMKVLALSDDSIFYSMVVGRAIFGAGAESLNVTQIAMVTEWFRDSKIMAMAFALTISMSRLGDFLSLISGQKIADYFGGFDYTLMTAAALSGVSMLAVIAYFVIDKYSRTRYYRKYLTPEPFGWENFRCVLRFEARFWLVSLCCMTYYAGVSPFVGMLSGWLSNKYGYKASDAGALSSVVILASMVLSPFLGKAVDLIGRRPLVVALGSLLVLPSHLVLAYTGPDYAFTVFPLWPIIAVGLSFSIVPSALWPCVPVVTPEAYTSTAFGVMTAVQNGGLMAVNFLVNWLRQHYGDESAMLFFVGADALGLILVRERNIWWRRMIDANRRQAVVLFVVDKSRGGQLSAVRTGEVVPDSKIDDVEEIPGPFETPRKSLNR